LWSGAWERRGRFRIRAQRGIWTAVVVIAALIAAPSAQANFNSIYGGLVNCVAQPASGNVRLCSGVTKTWDGQTKIDVDVILPPQPGGTDGPYPVIGDFHGWGGEKIGLNAQTQDWAERGYAVFSMSDRGWGQSCGSADLEKLLGRCEHGYNHLMDDRYEVRDAQFLIGELADEGVAEPKRIGATGMSYGGGISLALAALRNRTMLPDGSLVPWTSPGGKAMELAAAVPQWPWSDLAYALLPNGRTLDYVTESPYRGPSGTAPVGIAKSSFVTALFGLGLALSNYTVTDSEAAVPTWYARIMAGEPYDGDPTAESILDQVTTYHSSYYIDHAEEPAPLLIQSGWNDDLFPPDEALRYYERTRAQYPGDPISLFFMDDGHMRSQNKAADAAYFDTRLDTWFDHYLKGEGSTPGSSVEALTTTCPSTAPSEGPYSAPDWRSLSPGEIRGSDLRRRFRPDRRPGGLRDDLEHRPDRRRHLPPRRRPGSLHPDGLTDDRRRRRIDRGRIRARGTPRRCLSGRNREPGRARPLPTDRGLRPGRLPAPSAGLPLRRRPHRQARTAPLRCALRAAL
jgi:fermentation-respiration switch protein FrsA (DUF1100 family)